MDIIKKFKDFVEAFSFAESKKAHLKYVAKSKEYIVYNNNKNTNNNNNKNNDNDGNK